MRKLATAMLIVLLAMPVLLNAQPVNPTGSGNLITMPYNPVALPSPTSGLWTNSAGIGVDGTSGLIYMRPMSLDGYSNIYNSDYALGFNMGGLGFGMEEVNQGARFRRYTLAFSSEFSEGFTMGMAYHWSDNLARQNSWDVGMLMRPTRWLSIGANMTNVYGGNVAGVELDPTYNLGVALRPFGPDLTLTADVNLWKDATNDYGDEMDPTFTASWKALDGLYLRGGYALDSETAFAGLSFSVRSLEMATFNGFRSNAQPGELEDAGVSSVRLSSSWKPSIADRFMKDRIVKIRIDGNYQEEGIGFSFFAPHSKSMYSVLSRMQQIANDPEVAGLWLDLRSPSFRFSDLVEIRDALEDIKAKGKKIVVYSKSYGLGSYYLASVADAVFIYPVGSIIMPGINAKGLYYKELLDKLKIEPQFQHVGDYKSAAESYYRNDMSDEARESTEQFLKAIWDEFIGSIAEDRNVGESTVEGWIDNALHSARDAKEAGIVDELVYPDEFTKKLKEAMGLPESTPIVSEGGYFMTTPPSEEWDDMTSPKIAIVVAEGVIMTGKSTRNPFTGSKTLGSATLAAAIRNARENPRVKAIVLRVDSPGGSPLASDIVDREIAITTDDSIEGVRHIPVIVSMSDVAASGGYYISCSADKIVAPKTCITGSIGVVGGKFAFDGLLDTLGVSVDGVTFGKNAGVLGLERWNDEQLEIFYKSMEQTYDEFRQKVSKGRGMTMERVHELGQGRVWSGADALENGLIDEIGGLTDAIELAKEMANIKSDKVEAVIYPGMMGFNFRTEFQSMFSNQLPSSFRSYMEIEESLKMMEDNNTMLLAPINSESLILK
jgi:protease-4